MEVSTLVIAFCVAVFTLLPHCSSDQVDVQKTVRHYGTSAAHQSLLSPRFLPRKLNLHEQITVKIFSSKNIEPHRKMMEAPSGNKQENVMQKHKGTWREWVEEGPNRSEYFTMDYGWVRRRRPIHNRQVPIVP